MRCPPWLKSDAEQLTLQVKVKPGAKQNLITLDSAGCLQVSLQASPQEGKANQMLIRYLSKLLAVTQKQISIVRGTTSRSKVLSIKIALPQQEKLIRTLMDFAELSLK